MNGLPPRCDSRPGVRTFRWFLLIGLLTLALLPWAGAQQVPENSAPKPPTGQQDETERSQAPAKVDVQPVARDEEIQSRLQRVLSATGWFRDPMVEVREGVVFLTGRADTPELKKWAGDLARNTQDVVAVANRMELIVPSAWDFSGAWSGLTGLWRDFTLSLPLILFALLILGLSAGAGWLVTRGARSLLQGKIRARLLRAVVAYAAGVLVFLVGTYIVLRVSGLTQLALTVVGGTGLVGLAVGIAFRDITENFLASIFLSMQRPFESGDLIEVSGATGYVQQLNVRTTLLMTLEGNLVQVPNATIYKSILRNFTANPNRRETFVVGIGYDDPIDRAQEIARQVLDSHPAVLKEPEPWVLADGLGSSTVNLKIYFWLNGCEHSWLKVRSSVIRLVKAAYQEHGISMPDEAREVVFPKGIPVSLTRQYAGEPAEPPAGGDSAKGGGSAGSGDSVSTPAEGGLASEAGSLGQQARQAKTVDAGENLLDEPSSNKTPDSKPLGGPG